MGMLVNPSALAAGGTLTLRASGLVPISTSVSSQVVTFPASAAAGDYMVIFATHGFPVNIPAGWTNINQPGAGSDCNGATFGKALSSTDISNGSVTVTFTGSAHGIISYAVSIGGVTGVRATQAARGSTPSPNSRTLTTNSTPASGDVAFYWGSEGTNTLPTVDRGTSLQSGTSTSGFSARLSAEVLGSGGAVTANFTYPIGTVNGDYSIVLVIQP